MAAENGTNAGLESSLDELSAINKDINIIVEQLVDEEAALHAKYELKKTPLYKKRQEIIAKIPKFWLTCAISYLERIEIQRSAENPINYKVVFVFGENPYFSNGSLIKEFDFSDKGKAKVTNHTIQWKAGKDLTANAVAAAQDAAAKGQDDDEDGDNFSENEETSFFCWFDDANGSELADLIANDLFPNAGMYFTGAISSDDEEELVPFGDDSDVENTESTGSDEEAIVDAPATKRAKRA
ncbi:hypothetical protein GGF46_001285 [Coemansia sp. RSA 552]|nr:hypothetical protein GGF46_001285 [Coemansia sp. RSA 552]